MTLARLSTLTTVLLLALISVLLSGVVYPEWRTSQATANGLAAMGVLSKALVAAKSDGRNRVAVSVDTSGLSFA